jgi:uncharacterized membrane protein YkoI
MADGTEMEVEVDAAPGKIVKAEKDWMTEVSQ